MRSLVPFRKLEAIKKFPFQTEWLDRIFDEVPSLWGEQGAMFPDFDIAETDDHIVVKADLPGFNVEDLEISVNDNVLTVRGERREEAEDNKEYYHRMERRWGSFSRSFTLPTKVETDSIAADYKDGVLTLSIPKSETTKPKRIGIGVH